MDFENKIIDTHYHVRMPRIVTKLSLDKTQLKIRLMRKKDELFMMLCEISGNFDILKIFNTLEFAMGTRKLKGLQWSKDDLIFTQFIDIESFVSAYSGKSWNFKIHLYEPVKVILDEDEKQRIMNDAHISGNEHYGQKKTTEIVQTKYFWKKMTKDIPKYVKMCDQCIHEKNKFLNNDENSNGSQLLRNIRWVTSE